MTRLPMVRPDPQPAGPAGGGPGILDGRRVALVHLGCPKNLVDSEHMLASLAGAGAILAGGADDADALVLNTCAFIDHAKQESIDRILEAERWKQAGSGGGWWWPAVSPSAIPPRSAARSPTSTP